MVTKKNLNYYILLIAGILILINILAYRFFFRLDFTEDQRYTLSQSTVNILDQINQPVTITAYMSEGLQPQFDQMRKDFKDMLSEYASKTKGQIVYEFINPNKEEKLEREAVQAGIQPLLITIREKDQSVQKKAYLGAVVQVGEESEVIPFIRPGAQMEYALTMALKKLITTDKPAIGFITGHGEPPLAAFAQVKEGLDVLYVPEEVTLSDSVNLSKYKTLVWVNPQDSISDADFQLLDKYLEQGVNISVAINRVDAKLHQGYGFSHTTGLESWLQAKGVTVEDNFIIDANCGSVQVQQSNFPIPISISFPYLPIITHFADHPISEGLGNVVLQFASSMQFTDNSTKTFTPLAFTSDKSGTQPAPVYFNLEKRWTDMDFPKKRIPVAALVQDKNTGSKIVVVSDGDMSVNGTGRNARQIQPDNANFMVNAIDFMSDDTGLIQLRSKQVKMRPLDQIDESKKSWLKILNFILPILIIIAVGIIRYQKRRVQRLKRMEEDYV
jgi:gliding-associated putative ABC transporter substrate-binding component GldG